MFFENKQAMAMKKLYSHSFLAVSCPKLLHLGTNVKVNNPVPYLYKYKTTTIYQE